LRLSTSFSFVYKRDASSARPSENKPKLCVEVLAGPRFPPCRPSWHDVSLW
jgi:hypothetical protein